MVKKSAIEGEACKNSVRLKWILLCLGKTTTLTCPTKTQRFLFSSESRKIAIAVVNDRTLD